MKVLFLKKKIILIIFIVIVLLISGAAIIMKSGKKHYHKGFSFINDPNFKLFGASLIKENNNYIIKSYFQSSIFFRTEYIYEQFDITMPADIELNKEYDISKIKNLFFAKGGQGGQIETKDASGSFKVLKLDDNKIIIYINAEFKSFNTKGHYYRPPQSIKRRGNLKAEIGYKLY